MRLLAGQTGPLGCWRACSRTGRAICPSKSVQFRGFRYQGYRTAEGPGFPNECQANADHRKSVLPTLAWHGIDRCPQSVTRIAHPQRRPCHRQAARNRHALNAKAQWATGQSGLSPVFRPRRRHGPCRPTKRANPPWHDPCRPCSGPYDYAVPP